MYTPTNNNFNYEQILMMSIIPLMTSCFSSFFTSFFNDIKNIIIEIFILLFCFSKTSVNKYILKQYDDKNEMYIQINTYTKDYRGVTTKFSEESLPIIWHLNENIMPNKNILKKAEAYEYKENKENITIENKKNIQSNSKILFIPFIDFMKETMDEIKKKENNDNNIKTDTKKQKTQNIDFIDIEDNIELGFYQKTSKMFVNEETTISYMILASRKKTLAEISNYYMNIKNKYAIYHQKKSQKIFIYNNLQENGELDFCSYDIDKSQQINHIFMKNKQNIIDSIKNLDDIEFYEKNGLKRKVGHLYVGPPGSGKTCLATAIANMTNRSIVYIPISRIKTNVELQKIIYEKKFGGVTYDFNEIIFLLDELDSLENNKSLKKNIEVKDDKEKDNAQTIIVNTTENKINVGNKKDELNIGMILNILDGNTNQDGMIIIGTANNKNNIDPAIYRYGRMDLINFDYMDKNDISDMIECYFNVKLTDEQKNNINNTCTVQSLNLKNVCLQNLKTNMSIDDLIKKINELFI